MATHRKGRSGRSGQQGGLRLLRSEPRRVDRARQAMRVLYGPDLTAVARYPGTKSLSRMSHYQTDEAHASAAHEIAAVFHARADLGHPREDVELFALWIAEEMALAYRDSPAVQLTHAILTDQHFDSAQDIARTECTVHEMTTGKLERLRTALDHEISAKRVLRRLIDWELRDREARTA